MFRETYSNTLPLDNVLTANHNMCWSYFCLRLFSWSEVVFSNSFHMVNYDYKRNIALELLLSQTHFVIRDRISQRIVKWKIQRETQHYDGATFDLDTLHDQTQHSQTHYIGQSHDYERNTVLKSLLSQTHFVTRGSILQRNRTDKLTSQQQFVLDSSHFWMHVLIRNDILKRTFTWQRLDSHPQSYCDDRSDFTMSQNRHPFVDVQTSRGDGHTSVTFKRCAEISIHTEEMCSVTAS